MNTQDTGAAQQAGPVPFMLPDLEDPIVPATPEASGVQVIAVGIVLLVFIPVAADVRCPQER
jgi:hypothetical protein